MTFKQSLAHSDDTLYPQKLIKLKVVLLLIEAEVHIELLGA